MTTSKASWYRPTMRPRSTELRADREVEPMRNRGGLCRSHAVEKLVDLGLEPQALARQRLRGDEHLVRALAGLISTARGAADGVDDLSGAARCRADAVGDVLRRRALLLYGGRDRGGNAVDTLDGVADRLDGTNRFLGHGLHVGDLAGDLLGRLRGLPSQRLHLLRNHCKAATGVAGARPGAPPASSSRLGGGVSRA